MKGNQIKELLSCKTLFKNVTSSMLSMFVGMPVLVTAQDRITQNLFGIGTQKRRNNSCSSCQGACKGDCKGSCRVKCASSSK